MDDMLVITNEIIANLSLKLLADCGEVIPELSKLWYEAIGKKWVPGSTAESSQGRFKTHCNRDSLPLTLLAFYHNILVGTASLRISDGILPHLSPWLGSLIVHPDYQNNSLGKYLINEIKLRAQALGYTRLYLLTFDPTLPTWYKKLGWNKIGDECVLGNLVTVMETSLSVKF